MRTIRSSVRKAPRMASPRRFPLIVVSGVVAACAVPGAGEGQADRTREAVSRRAQEVANYALEAYFDSTLATLGDLVSFRTVRRPGVPNAGNPEFRALTEYLEAKAGQLGLDFEDHGAVVLIGLGESTDRLGLVTHADVQPADPSKWARDPFSLDRDSEPGRLVGRGIEDDKGPIASALWAMKAVADQEVALTRRIELVISYTEESDWGPFQRFLAERPPPDLNVAMDSEYPVVIAEKGFGAIFLTLPSDEAPPGEGPHLAAFTGGAFLSQIPEDAIAVIEQADDEVVAALRRAADSDSAVRFTFEDGSAAGTLTVRARGVSAHSSKPWDGRNAITHLAALLAVVEWQPSQASTMVRLVNDLVGLGDYAEKFGDLAFSHDFMGPLTLSLTTLELGEDGSLTAGVNLRAPAGRSAAEKDRAIGAAVEAWKRETGIEELDVRTSLGDPYYLEDAPHIPVLLEIFRHYTGQTNAAPVSIGGGTHARLLPNGLNFGPAMPGEPYTGHSEHEYMTESTYRLNLQMYTAMLVELAGA